VITLREYQSQAIEDLRASFRAGHHSPLLVMPTGAGKTVCFSYLTQRLTAAGKRVVILVHREELIRQVSDTLTAFGVRHGLIAAGALYDRRLLAHAASVFALARRLDRVAVPDYVICDEAHHCIAGSSWGKVVAHWRQVNPALRLIGVSATPERLSGEGLGEVFDDMILGPTVRQLIDLGSLSEYRMYAPRQAVDLTGIARRGGDYARGEVAAAMDKPAIHGDAVAHYRRHCDGAPAVAFCVSVEHAEHVAESFRASGYRSASIDGSMPREIRRGILQDFSRGGLNVLTSCDLISEGFDVPGIVAAILLRPTQSLALYLQQVGRALRVAPGKSHAVILDHVGNSARHGAPCQDREWSLIGRDAASRKTKAGEAAVRQCESCFAVSPAAASSCRECGKAFPVRARELDQVEGELSEVEVAKLRIEAKRAQAAAQTLEDLIAEGQRRGFKNPAGWARHVWDGRMKKRGVA
jgi:superfamily II DNA or RNA helicase